ncbi:hypothetical protein HMPREF9120_02629 [Neisseria sp. oral taxon 020 str. F0370]|nr:hypothetical protein HMPREF9120_02629 [Neisseria sp. oral taxon 020 str. F0370]
MVLQMLRHGFFHLLLLKISCPKGNGCIVGWLLAEKNRIMMKKLFDCFK